MMSTTTRDALHTLAIHTEQGQAHALPKVTLGDCRIRHTEDTPQPPNPHALPFGMYVTPICVMRDILPPCQGR